ncbi:MAG TPA: hypothetical protein VKV36_09160 [Acidimicrobiales bacterium]|nr:hypothetical protein [Acidimicrobiales bacterium]
MAHAHLATMPERIATGAYIVSSGLSKLQAEKETADGLHSMAATVYPVLEKTEPARFAKGLGLAETVLGGALLLPMVGDGVAGFALAAFSGGLLGLYLKTPGMRREGSLRPTERGTPFAKDVWLLGIGLSLMVNAARARSSRRSARRRARAATAGSRA